MYLFISNRKDQSINQLVEEEEDDKQIFCQWIDSQKHQTCHSFSL